MNLDLRSIRRELLQHRINTELDTFAVSMIENTKKEIYYNSDRISSMRSAAVILANCDDEYINPLLNYEGKLVADFSAFYDAEREFATDDLVDRFLYSNNED